MCVLLAVTIDKWPWRAHLQTRLERLATSLPPPPHVQAFLMSPRRLCMKVCIKIYTKVKYIF